METVQQHLSKCTDCAVFADDMQKTLEVLNDEKVPQANPFFYTRVKAKLEYEQEGLAATETRPVWLKVLQPVFFTVLLLLGIYGGFKITQPETVQLAHIEMQDELVPYLNEMEAEPIEAFLME